MKRLGLGVAQGEPHDALAAEHPVDVQCDLHTEGRGSDHDERAPLDRFTEPVRELEERMIRDLTSHQADQFRQSLSKAWHALS